jgi:hypothetical protein
MGERFSMEILHELRKIFHLEAVETVATEVAVNILSLGMNGFGGADVIILWPL